MKKLNKIPTIIIDDHNMFLDGIRNLLSESDLVEIRYALSDTKRIEKILENNKDITLIITDINIPGRDGIELSKYIKSKYPNIKIIILSMLNQSDIIHKLLNIGIDGYLLKNANIEELNKAIKSVFYGEKYFSKTVMEHYMNSMFSPKKIKHSKVNLTRREIEIIVLISKEMTNIEIAKKLFLSIYTVETHRRNILHKINAKNTAGIVRYAVQHGLI